MRRYAFGTTAVKGGGLRYGIAAGQGYAVSLAMRRRTEQGFGWKTTTAQSVRW